MNKILYATSTLVGTTIGIGIFGIPFVFMKAGFLTGILFLALLTFITLILNLAFGEITLRTDGSHQITGYAEVYLGQKWKKAVLFSFIFGIYAALLAYIIVSGEFLTNISSVTFFSFSPFVFSTLFFIVVSLVTLGGLKNVSKIELLISAALIGTIFLVLFLNFSKIHLGSLSFFRKEFFFLPYGVLFFALRGFPAVPLQREVLEGKEEYLKKAVWWGTLIPAAVYLLFAFIVVGISGEATSPEAVSGLSGFLKFPFIFLISLFGLFAITTSFLGLGVAMMEMFQYDFHLSKMVSWMLTVIPPYFLFLSGTRNFIDVINLSGAVAIGLESIVFVFLYQKVKSRGHRIPEYSLNLPKWLWYAMIALFIFGIIYTLVF